MCEGTIPWRHFAPKKYSSLFLTEYSTSIPYKIDFYYLLINSTSGIWIPFRGIPGLVIESSEPPSDFGTPRFWQGLGSNSGVSQGVPALEVSVGFEYPLCYRGPAGTVDTRPWYLLLLLFQRCNPVVWLYPVYPIPAGLRIRNSKNSDLDLYFTKIVESGSDLDIKIRISLILNLCCKL